MMDRTEFFQYATKHRGISPAYLSDYSRYTRNMTRTVIEERPNHFREIDVFSRLIMDRIIFLGTDVNSQISNIIIAQLLFLASTDNQKDIYFYINSPGGSVHDGLGIYDTMQYINPPVATFCTGLAASMGALLLAGGAKGKRSALPHARIMIHQPLGRAQGQASDMETTVKQVLELRQEIFEILAEKTGQPLDKIKTDADRDYWMKAQQAVAYGLIDEVIVKSK